MVGLGSGSGEGSGMDTCKSGSFFVHQDKGDRAEGGNLGCEDGKQLEVTRGCADKRMFELIILGACVWT